MCMPLLHFAMTRNHPIQPTSVSQNIDVDQSKMTAFSFESRFDTLLPQPAMRLQRSASNSKLFKPFNLRREDSRSCCFIQRDAKDFHHAFAKCKSQSAKAVDSLDVDLLSSRVLLLNSSSFPFGMQCTGPFRRPIRPTPLWPPSPGCSCPTKRCSSMTLRLQNSYNKSLIVCENLSQRKYITRR